MIEGILTILGSPLLGGLVGMVGSYFTRKEERKFKESEWAHDYKMSQLNAENKRKELQLQGDLTEKELEGKAFVTSQQTTSSWADNIRAIVRPIITAYLMFLMTMIGLQVNELVGGMETLPMDQIILLYSDIISGIVFLTITAVTWWFGTRNTQAIKNMNSWK